MKQILWMCRSNQVSHQFRPFPVKNKSDISPCKDRMRYTSLSTHKHTPGSSSSRLKRWASLISYDNWSQHWIETCAERCCKDMEGLVVHEVQSMSFQSAGEGYRVQRIFWCEACRPSHNSYTRRFLTGHQVVPNLKQKNNYVQTAIINLKTRWHLVPTIKNSNHLVQE